MKYTAYLLCFLTMTSSIFAGPTFIQPKGVEPTVTETNRESGLLLRRIEWISPTVRTKVCEVSSEGTVIVMHVNQMAFGKNREFTYSGDSGFEITTEHPVSEENKKKNLTIEKDGKFIDGFTLDMNGEIEPFPDEWIEQIKSMGR